MLRSPLSGRYLDDLSQTWSEFWTTWQPAKQVNHGRWYRWDTPWCESKSVEIIRSDREYLSNILYREYLSNILCSVPLEVINEIYIMIKPYFWSNSLLCDPSKLTCSLSKILILVGKWLHLSLGLHLRCSCIFEAWRA